MHNQVGLLIFVNSPEFNNLPPLVTFPDWIPEAFPIMFFYGEAEEAYIRWTSWFQKRSSRICFFFYTHQLSKSFLLSWEGENVEGKKEWEIFLKHVELEKYPLQHLNIIC